MGFEPQTSGQPLINVHKRTTKVNIFMVGAVVVFLLLGLAGIVWASLRAENDTPASVPIESHK